jgi:MFS family permease
MTERWLPAWALAAVAFGGASLIVPLYVVELGGDAAVLGILFATSSFVGVPGSLVFGNLADRTGRRRGFVLGAMAITVGSMLVIPLLDDVAPVVVANALLWLGFAAATPILNLLAVAGEPTEEWSRLIARLNKFQGIGWVLGLALGFVVTSVGARYVDPLTAQRIFFGACAVCAVVGFALGFRTLPLDSRPRPEPSRRRLQRYVARAGRFNVRGASFPFTPGRFDPRGLHPRRLLERYSPTLVVYFGAVVLVFTGFGVFFAPLPAYLSGLGYGSSQIFGMYVVLNAGAAACYGPAGALARRYRVGTVHAGGLLVRGVLLPAIAVVGAILGGSTLGFGVGTALFAAIGTTWAIIAVTAVTLVTSLAAENTRGEALGMYGALVALGGGAGGLLGGWLAGAGFEVAFGVAGGLVIAGALIVGLLSRRADGPIPHAD